MIIGFAGAKGAGKDTCAHILVEKLGFSQYAFADPLKQAAQQVFDLTHDQLYGSDKETIDMRYNKTPRQLLQLFGVEFIRTHISKDFWVQKFHAYVTSCLAARGDVGNIVVSDVRFQNEVEAIKAHGGVVYVVHRPSLPPRTDMHTSEDVQALVGCSGNMNNSDDMLDLEKQVLRVLIK